MKKTVFLKKIISIAMCGAFFTLSLAGCSGKKNEDETTYSGVNGEPVSSEQKEPMELNIKYDESITYQTMESFGASGSWWSQDVGGWSDLNVDGTEVREQIATLLFDKENGIGLSAYRYNIGAGSADSGASFDGITDLWRRAESFETEAGVYDWTKDENAVWFLTKAKDMGVSELVFFCNSPLERLTKNGMAYGDKAQEGGTTSNLPAENYKAFANYVMDVVEHFINEGYPIKYISPINEPQWEWTGGQEGCHYEPEEVAEFLCTFLDVMEQRNLEGVELSAPELGEWGNTSYKYYEAIFENERLSKELTALDVHSYWSDTSAKQDFIKWLGTKNITVPELKMSEWCEMVNGKDLTMDSALNLATEIYTDVTKLNVTSWQYWIGVSCYNYRDGLIYVNNNTKDVWETKRLWAMGNYSRFVRPGYTRIECTSDAAAIGVSAFAGKDESGRENLVIVAVNKGAESYNIPAGTFEGWSTGNVYVTDETHSLEKTQEISGDSGEATVPSASVVTITLVR